MKHIKTDFMREMVNFNLKRIKWVDLSYHQTEVETKGIRKAKIIEK